jgi:hypothetical protein
MLRMLVLGIVVLELVLGIAHVGIRLARAPAEFQGGWPLASELEPYRWLEPYARGRRELGLVLVDAERGSGTALDLVRYRAQLAIAPTRLVSERRAGSLVLVGGDPTVAAGALRAQGFRHVQFDPVLPLALASEHPAEMDPAPDPLPPRAPPMRLAALALATLLPLAFAWRRGGPATAACLLALAPGALALCAAASDANGLPEAWRTPLLALAWPLALFALARVLPAFEPPGPGRARLRGAWRAAFAVLSVAGFAALALALGAMPDGGWDAQAMYAVRARTIVLAPDFLAPFADYPGARELHPDYPPLVPFALAGAWRLAGGADPVVAMGVQLAFAIGFAGLCVRWALRRGGPLLALLALSLTALAPFWHDRIAGQECDVPLGALFGVAALVLAWRYPERALHEDARHVLACGIALAFAALTKTEGRFFVLAFGCAVAIELLRRGIQGRRALVGLGATLAPAALLLVLLSFVTPPNDLIAAFDPARASWSRASTIGHAFARLGLRPQELRLLPLLLAPFAIPLVLRGLAALRAGRRDALILEAGLAVTLAFLTAVYFVAYLTTPADLDWHIATSLVRLGAQLWPGLVVLALALAARGLGRAPPAAAPA